LTFKVVAPAVDGDLSVNLLSMERWSSVALEWGTLDLTTATNWRVTSTRPWAGGYPSVKISWGIDGVNLLSSYQTTGTNPINL